MNNNEFKPFEDEDEVTKITNKRQKLIQDLENFEIPEDEKRFLIRKINNISDKLLKKARYAKKRV